jgi:acetyl-CoA synthetase
MMMTSFNPDFAPANMLDYEDWCASFSWESEAEALGLPHPQYGYNKAALCLIKQTPHAMAKPALHWVASEGQAETYSFQDMHAASNRLAHYFQDLGIQPGDRIFVFLDRIPELYLAVFAALKCQAIVGPLFSAFGPDALQDRIQDCGAKLVITSPALKPRIDMIRADCPSIERVLIVNRQADYTPQDDSEVLYYPAIQAYSEVFDIPYTEADVQSIIHYTSGTTGKPKGVVHRHFAIIAQAATAKYVLDIQPDDIYWCTADPGWVTGTSYGILGPWALGVTSVVMQGGFSPEKWYQLIQDYKVSIWYTAPTAIRMLMKAGDTVPTRYDFSSLRRILSVGEPLNPEAIVWGERVFGKTFLDTWWQTETGSMHICNYAALPVKHGSMGRPFAGTEAAILDDEGQPTPLGEEGYLVLRPTSPSFFKTYWGKPDVYASRFKNGWYFTGDRAFQDKDGYFWFIGRADDVINTAGHLVGPFEVESALIEHPAVAEAGVIGKPDAERQEIIKAFVSLNSGVEATEDLKREIQTFVREKLAAHAYPREIEFIDNLPKTRSGKIMRRLLKARELGLPEGDTSTLED